VDGDASPRGEIDGAPKGSGSLDISAPIHLDVPSLLGIVFDKLIILILSIMGLMSVKVTINNDECTGCGLCYNDECPDVFEEDDDGNSRLKAQFRKGGPQDGEIPEDKKGCAQSASDACPVSAITVG